MKSLETVACRGYFSAVSVGLRQAQMQNKKICRRLLDLAARRLISLVSNTVAASSEIDYKIGNERLIKVTENASHNLAGLSKSKAAAVRCASMILMAVVLVAGLQYKMDLVDGTGQSRHHRAIVGSARGGRSEERVVRERLAPRLQQRQRAKGGRKINRIRTRISALLLSAKVSAA